MVQLNWHPLLVLVFVDEAHQMCFFLVKPADVASYVEHGAADIGIVGRDILL